MNRSFKKRNTENFNSILNSKLESFSNYVYFEFGKVFLNELKRHGPLKMNMLKHIDNTFMAK